MTSLEFGEGGRSINVEKEESVQVTPVVLGQKALHPYLLHHNVEPSDTLAGICIRYRCKAFELRRVNGITWGDNIRLVKVLLVPQGGDFARRKRSITAGAETRERPAVDKQNTRQLAIIKVDDDRGPINAIVEGVATWLKEVSTPPRKERSVCHFDGIELKEVSPLSTPLLAPSSACV